METLAQAFPERIELIGLTVHRGTADIWGVATSTEEKNGIQVTVENMPGGKPVDDHIGLLQPYIHALNRAF